ncbi:YkgJ family cysteine cluster protein [Rhizobium sp. FKL33]|uniref:YkgJ family cysteine cluster protein n=1 Tax=Rhizobium sp. FKL33 TaxID=2562307 RepID=UPI001FF07438|nr:YkgJ family cysteine cluster protein [Rhizobium sp. FKL33]
MSERRFACTACGLCCNGLVPLTVREAVDMADRFPLAMMITPVKPGTRGQSVLEKIGASVILPPKKRMQLLVSPVSFVPPSMPCPQLTPDNLCGIHATKPIRCRTMPFYAYKDEEFQADLLQPRGGWLCDISDAAPVVYRNQHIVDREDFDIERSELMDQGQAIRRYVDLLLKHSPVMTARVAKAAGTTPMGRVVASFVSYLRYDRNLDLSAFARAQQPVLQDWLERTGGSAKAAEFSNYYREASAELQRYL